MLETIPSAEMLEHFCKVQGAIAVSEALALHATIVRELKMNEVRGVFCDLGSHAGKSSMIIAHAMKCLGWARKGTLRMIEPYYDRSPENIAEISKWPGVLAWRHCYRDDFNEWVYNNVAKYSDECEISLWGGFSEDYLSTTSDTFACVFIDTADHEEDRIRRECALLDSKMNSGGLIFFHDFGNYSAPIVIHRELIAQGKYSAIELDWSNDSVAASLEAQNDSWHAKWVGTPTPHYVGCLRRN